MYRNRLTGIGMAVCVSALVSSALAEEQKMIVYAPDVLGVDRLFMIAVRAPAGEKVEVTMPANVAPVDRTDDDAKTDVRKFYFRTVKPGKNVEIKFALPGGQVVVPVEIWSYEELRQYRKLKGKQLPRRWPLGKPLPELKQAQTITTEVEKKALAGSTRGSNWLSVADDVLWDLQPDSTIPRWHWTNIRKGCPVHGAEIYKKRSYYPWVFDSAIPRRWKIKCPIGGEEYPSNDFANGDMTGGEFPDDGIGGAYLQDGERYGFIAEIAQHYCRVFMQIAPACADGYVGTGDVKYAHKALVAMCRLAEEFAYLATMTQHRHRNSRSQVDRIGQAPFSEGPCLSPGSGFTVYPIELPGHQVSHAEAYDKIFPGIAKDPEIVPFLQSKGYNVKTHEDVRRFIEENLFAVWMQGSMDAACASNEPYSQWGYARMAEMLNYAAGDAFMDHLYNAYRFEFTPMRIFVPNGFFRDGAPYESTGGYNGMHVSALKPIVESIEHLRELRPGVYPESKYPDLTKGGRYRSIFDFSMDTVTIDRSYPHIGDGGSHPVHAKRSKITWQNGGAEAFEQAYQLYRDPKFAWALVNHRGWKPSRGFPFTREQLEKEAAKWPADWNDRSALHDGYGIAILRGGTGDRKRALWMAYGRPKGHVHDDIMDIGMDGYEGTLLAHMGYPRQWSAWEGNWLTHNLARQVPFVSMSATAQFMADVGPLHLAEARAQVYVDRVDDDGTYELPPDDWQRRTIALVDVDDDRFYCLDFYRISGGKEHWWTFHAQEGDLATEGLTLAKQDGGTLAGADVPYADDEWLKAQGCRRSNYGWSGVNYGFPHLYNVQRAKPPAVWSADWALKSSKGMHMRLTVPQADGAEVIVCDGKSPAGGSPYEMKWLLMHRQGAAPLRTQILSVIEPYRDQPVVKSVRPLALSGNDEGGFAAAACVVELADGTVDTVFASADPTVQRTAEGGFTFAGRFGLHRERKDGSTQIALVGGTRLTKGEAGITGAAAEYRATITAVNRADETITVSPAPPNPDDLVGKYIFVKNPVRRIACKVASVKAVAGGVQLALGYDSRIGTGLVSGAEDHRVLTATPFPLHRHRYYHGARVTNGDRSAEYRIIEVRDKSWALIDAKAHPDAKADKLTKQFPPGSWFDVYDYGVGDEVVHPHATTKSGS